MALVAMRELLQDARKRNYAVGGFNVFNFETLSAVVEVAEELKTPLVLGMPERLFKFVDSDTLAAAMVKAANKCSTPVALHLDHAHSYEGIMRAVRWGFTSIMYDGSSLSLNENMKRTKEIARIAHSLNITVEGGVGYLGSKDIGDPMKPDDVLGFIDKTRIDALAIAVNGHEHDGHVLDFPYIRVLADSSIPLVLHGGSKLSKADYSAAIKAGICKINIATDTSLAAAKTLKQELTRDSAANYIHLMSAVKKGVKDTVRQYMLHFDCISKAV